MRVQIRRSTHIRSGVDPANPPRAPLVSEYLYLEREVLLGIFPDRFDQLTRLEQRLVQVVVERWILEQPAGRAFARFQTIGENRQLGQGVIELLGQCLVLGQLAERTFSG